MLQITADVFSGRPNPVWVVSDETEARATLRELVSDRSLLADAEPAESGLGFRGLWIEALSDELALDFQLGQPVYLAVGPQARGARASELAERLIGLMERGEVPVEAAEDVPPPEAPLRDLLTTQLEGQSSVSLADAAAPPAAEAEEVTAAVTCTIELGAYNPGFWNNDSTVRSRNNCYNYATNRRTDTFAQPGRGCGRMYTAITCAEVTRAGLCDGLHRRYDCFPDSERSRYLVAMVVAPGPGFVDYHWYRLQKEGFWGHKPGSTAARNVDNSGRVITDPRFCDRGPYTLFCGFFYTCRTQWWRIR
jgi:hypothetical protein